MTHSFTLRFLKKITTPVMLILLCSMLWGYELIKHPKITHSEAGVKQSKLVLVKQIYDDFGPNLFFARPIALTVDDENSLYVFDNVLKRVFKFNSKFQYETSFLREGRGPSEVSAGVQELFKIAYAPNNSINICDTLNKKLIVFSKKGKHIKDIRLDREYAFRYYPVMDAQSNLYTISVNGGVVDKLDTNMKIVHTFLDRRLNERFVVHMPALNKGVEWRGYLHPTLDDTYYDVINGQDLIIYMARPSTLFLFKDKQLIQRFDIILEAGIEKIRKSVAQLPKVVPKSVLFPGYWGTMFDSFFVDKDDERFFYLQTKRTKEQIRLYKFNIQKELVGILTADPSLSGMVMAKKNGYFYGIDLFEGHLLYFKEGK